MKKYAINILVILFLLTPFTLFANGCHANNDTIKVLAIGNSFSQDAVEQYLHELGEAEGITMIIGNMFIGGCSLERHVQNIRNNAPAYAYRKVEKDGEKTETRSMTIEKALADEKWDYISVQQASPLSGIYDSYKASLPELVNYIRERIGKETVLMVHQTWAYATNANHTGFKNYDQNQMKMYTSIVDAVKKAANLDELAKIINVDPNRLKATIESYNKVARHEVETDQFGFKANHTDDRPMTEGPWYVARKVPTIHHTMGGIHIDTGAHAVNANGQRIPGLYAAGEVTGGIHGANRLGGNAVADLMVFGRIAGKNAAEAK